MKTVGVSEIIRTAQLSNTRYVLASEAGAEIAALRERIDELQKELDEQNRSTHSQNLAEKLRESKEREQDLVSALEGLYRHTKNDMQLAGLNIAARAAFAAKEE